MFFVHLLPLLLTASFYLPAVESLPGGAGGETPYSRRGGAQRRQAGGQGGGLPRLLQEGLREGRRSSAREKEALGTNYFLEKQWVTSSTFPPPAVFRRPIPTSAPSTTTFRPGSGPS